VEGDKEALCLWAVCHGIESREDQYFL
jgi:hypothetical protein